MNLRRPNADDDALALGHAQAGHERLKAENDALRSRLVSLKQVVHALHGLLEETFPPPHWPACAVWKLQGRPCDCPRADWVTRRGLTLKAIDAAEQ